MVWAAVLEFCLYWKRKVHLESSQRCVLWNRERPGGWLVIGEACLGYAAERAIGKEWLMVDEIVASNWEVGWILRGLGGREVSSHFHLSMFPASVDRPAHTITVHLADLTVPDDQPISTELNQPAKKVVQFFSHFGPEQTQIRPPGDHSHEVGGRRVNHLHRWPLSPSQLGEKSLTELPLELARTASERHRGRVSLSVGRSKGHLTIDEALLDKCSSHLESRCQSSCQTAWPTRCAALWRLLTGLDISVLPSCWSSRSLTVKLTTSTCQGVEMQAGGTPGGRWVGGRWVELHWWAEPTKPQPQRTEMPPGRGEDRFEGKCTTEPVAHLWFVGQLRPVPRFFVGFSWFTFHQNHLQFFRYYTLWTFKDFLFGDMRSLRRKSWCGEGAAWAAPWFPLSGGRGEQY